MPGNITSTVEVAWNAGYTTPAASRTWTDITDKVEPGGVDIQRGRQNEQADVSPSTCGLTLDNRDGRFTPEYVAGAYYPNVKKGRPIRVRTGFPNQVIAFDNFTTADDPDVIWDASALLGRTTPTGGYTWTGDAVRDWGVISSAAYTPVSANTFVHVDVGQADVSVEASVTTGAALNDSGISVRYVDINNRICARVDSGGGGRWLVQKIVGGATTNVATGGVAAVSTTYALKVVCSGSSVDLYVGGVLTVSATVADAVLQTPTLFGMKAITNDYRFDDFTVRGTVYTTQFLGYVDEWPVEWPGGSDAMATASIKATSRMARLSLGLPYRSIVEEEILDDDPVLYFPLGEPEGATEAGNIAAGRSERLVVTQMGSGGTLTFGAGTGPGTDDLTAPVFAPVDDVNGKTLVATLSGPVIQATDTVAHLEAWVVTSSTAFSYSVICTSDNDLTTSAGLFIGVQAGTGKAFAAANAPATAPGVGGIQVQTNSPGSVANGNLHHLVGTFTRSGSNLAVDITVDGVETSGASTPWGTSAFPSHTKVIVGGTDTPSQPSPFPGTIAHAAIHSGTTAVTDARFVQHYNVGTTATYTEASGARIARYARLAGIPTAEISTETGLSTSIAHRDTTGQSAIQMMQDVAHTEDGVVFDGKDGTLTFHARDHRYAATSAFTLSCADGEVEANLSPVLDDQGMLNDVTASREGGATARSVNQASIDEYGVYRDSVELMTTSDNEVQSRADWEVNRRGTPRVKLTAVTVDVMAGSDAQAALILAADIGTRFTVSNLPAQAPATSMDFFVEGITYDIADDRFVATFNTSAAALFTAWILDSATLSQLDSTTVLAY